MCNFGFGWFGLRWLVGVYLGFSCDFVGVVVMMDFVFSSCVLLGW